MKTVMSGINKVYDGFNKINEWFIIFLMALMCLDLLAQVVCRYVFSYPLTWSLTSVLFIFYYLQGGWLKRRIKKEQQKSLQG